MKTYDLNKKIIFSSEKPIKQHFLNAKGFHNALICLKKGVEIPPHPEPYAVFFNVMEGRGIFTSEDGEVELNKGDSIFMKSNKIRGIKCIEKLSILGVQDGH